MSENSSGGVTQTNDEVDLSAEIEDLKQQLNAAISERDNFKTKFRNAELKAKSATELQENLDRISAERDSIKTEFDGFKEAIKTKELDQHLNTALEAAGAKSIQTVLKLLDKSLIQYDEKGQLNQDSITSMVNDLKKSDPFLFKEQEDDSSKGNSGAGTLKPPTVKSAAHGINTSSAMAEEFKNAKTLSEVEAIYRKYNI